MYTVTVKRKRRTMLGSYTSFTEAAKAAIAWWSKETAQHPHPEDIKGTWLESYDHQKDTRMWFFIPEVSALEALGWNMPGCEIRSAS
ncbi:hypothetical protein [Deinococcus roseus]|uniref:Uncharacterized protein n=1 Tax=Deinococcus roseus TaxID=392414 RepID=A0ABQ2CWQ6_9DEIO|nr:hypothetical protein [Deinococcus roseus]GGJ28275.1 hypothetical protein GCM10008938_12940 [Deinococcus roseus]